MSKKSKNKKNIHIGIWMTCITYIDSIYFVDNSRIRLAIYGLGFSDIRATECTVH